MYYRIIINIPVVLIPGHGWDALELFKVIGHAIPHMSSISD